MRTTTCCGTEPFYVEARNSWVCTNKRCPYYKQYVNVIERPTMLCNECQGFMHPKGSDYECRNQDCPSYGIVVPVGHKSVTEGITKTVVPVEGCPSCNGLDAHAPNCPTGSPAGNGKLYIDPDVATWDSSGNPREDVEAAIERVKNTVGYASHHPGPKANFSSTEPKLAKESKPTEQYVSSRHAYTAIDTPVGPGMQHASLEAINDALCGVRGQDQLYIAQVGLDWIALILRKNKDYGGSIFESPVLNPTMPCLSAIEVRMSDKIKRIQTLATQQAEVTDESLDDTYRDLGAYCLLRAVAKIKFGNLPNKD